MDKLQIDCDNCGDTITEGEPHHCPVIGSKVEITRLAGGHGEYLAYRRREQSHSRTTDCIIETTKEE
jgi:hypothetical protein